MKVSDRRVLLIIALILSLTLILGRSNTSITKAIEKPAKKNMDMLIEVSSLISSIKYKEARRFFEENYDIIKDNDMGLNAYGFLEFHIFKNYERAEKLHKRAIGLNPENPEHFKGIGSIYKAKGKFKRAVDFYEKAIELTSNKSKLALNPELALLYKEIGYCYLKLNNINKAIEMLEVATTNNPYSIETNAILHRLYVEEEEYEKAYDVWKNDNLINENRDHVYKGILEWNRLYKEAVEDRHERNHLKMAELYTDLVLYDEAAIEYEKAYFQDKTNGDIRNKLDEIKTYLLFRDRMKSLLDNYYRERCINGEVEELTFYERIKPAYEIIAPLFHRTECNSGATSIWIENLNKEIEKKFNVRIEAIKANGSMLGLHHGRIIDKSKINFTLWGEEANLTVVTLKNMASNGLDNWRYKKGGVGGWSLNSSEIVRVILDDSYDTMLQLASLYNADEVQELRKRFGVFKMEKRKREPLELYYSPEIQIHFVTKQANINAEEAKINSIPEDKYQGYIFAKIEKDYSIKTTIYAHESQHSIDSKNRVRNTWLGESEYRAKLSELAYGNMQFLTLSGCYSSSIGVEVNNTHTKANTQLYKDIVQYIYENSSKFLQIDIKTNILAQLNKLSEDDIRFIAIEIYKKNYDMLFSSNVH